MKQKQHSSAEIFPFYNKAIQAG